MDMYRTLTNLDYKVFENVYNPAEDSFLLTKHSAKLKGRILEIGCGSGIVCLTNAKNNPENEIVACDRNDIALKNALENAKPDNITNVKFLKSNLFSKITKGEKFDHILFNPPYLPTSKQDKIKGKLNHAYDGGIDGRKTLDRFLKQFEKFLKPEGSLLLIQSSLNDFDKTKQILINQGFKVSVLEQVSFFFEKLMVLKITKE